MEVTSQLHTLHTLPPGIATSTHWTGSQVNPSISLDAVMKRKISTPAWN